MTIPAFVHEDLSRLGIEAAAETLEAMGRFLELMLETNRRMNLTAVRDPDEAWRRHIIDSLTLLPWLADLPSGSRIVDVGSGGGVPGLPVAIAMPDMPMTLLEATGKKAKFLEQCVSELGLSHVRVVNDRAEKAGQDKQHRQRYDVAICRALGPMRELLEYTLPLVKVDGYLLAMKGPKAEAELKDAGDAMAILGGGDLEVYEAYPEGFDQNTVIVRLAKVADTPKQYPRLPGVPRHEPL